MKAETICDDVTAMLKDGGVLVHVSSRAARIGVGDALVTVTRASYGRVPNGIGVKGDIDFHEHGVTPRAAVRLAEQYLVLSPSLTIDLSDASAGSSSLPRARSPHPGALALLTARKFAEELPSTRGLVHLVHPCVGCASGIERASVMRTLPDVISLLRGGDGWGAANAARPLIGFGEGLTPSADDVLVGVAALLWAWRWSAFSDFTAAVAGSAFDLTTIVSADLLMHASQGRFASPLHALVLALDANHQDSTLTACQELLTVGASSGADLLTGALIGASVLTSQPLQRELVS